MKSKVKNILPLLKMKNGTEEQYNNNNKLKKPLMKKKNKIDNDNLYFGILIILG